MSDKLCRPAGSFFTLSLPSAQDLQKPARALISVELDAGIRDCVMELGADRDVGLDVVEQPTAGGQE
jgi:hypothetical protein